MHHAIRAATSGTGARSNLRQYSSILADLVYFLGLAVLTTYIGAHRGLTSKSKQQLSVKEVDMTCVTFEHPGQWPDRVTTLTNSSITIHSCRYNMCMI